MGIDVGTNESKGVLIDENCQIIHSEVTGHGLENPKPNYYEHDAEAVWWGDICKLSKALLANSGISNHDIHGIGVSALSADVVPVDKNCKPLRKAILYGIDSRATEEIDYITDYYGPKRIEKLIGRPLCSSDCMPKILWIKNNEPEIYSKTYKFLTASSYITAKLTGNYVIDRYLAGSSFAPCYNNDLSINQELAKELYCDPEQLAIGRETADVVGSITKNAAEATGLLEGTPVVTGTDDSGAEAISTGVLNPGDLMIQLGSTCYIIYCSDKLITDERIWSEDYIIPGTYSLDGGTNAAGALTKWVRDTFYQDLKATANGENVFSIMAKKAVSIPPGCNGIITLPYFSGERTPINDASARGMIFGLTLNHTRDHIYRSALEGVGFSIAQHVDIFKEHGLKIKNFMCVGGGAQNREWLQIIADITGHTVKTAAVTIGASYGDAMIAAIGTGFFKDYATLSRYIKPGQVIEPNMENHTFYQPMKQMYKTLYEATKNTMHQLSN
ncbi:MAG: FGGY-family carbohydrate kinase [Lachnospiraceae bacterium]|nr:FGGY-family carbohydrate kinase [Lachnospiraceae bacterium]